MENPATIDRHTSACLRQPIYQLPATLAQQAFWFLAHVDEAGSMWNIAVRFRLQGMLDIRRLGKALQLVGQRHEALRTAFRVVDDEVVQVVYGEVVLPLPVGDLSGMDAVERARMEEEWTLEEGRKIFHLGEGPLIRARLLRFAEDDHTLLLTVHHIVADGWSIGVISDDLAAFYAALGQCDDPQIPPLALQFGDFAIAEEARQRDSSIRGERLWWREKLANLAPCEMPTDFPRPERPTHPGNIVSQVLPLELTDAMEGVAHQHGATLFMFSVACLKLLIHRCTGATDLYIGTLLAGRDQVELERVVGIFVNTLVLRSQLDPQSSFADFLKNEAAEIAEAMAHQQVPFSQVMSGVRSRYGHGRAHFYSVNFIFQRDFVTPRKFDGIELTPIPSRSPGAIYDLNFFMVRRADGWRLSCEYDAELYRQETVQTMLELLQRVFAEAIADPQRKITSFAADSRGGSAVLRGIRSLVSGIA